MKEIKAHLHSINFQGLPLEDIIKVLKENHLFDPKIHSFTSLRRILNEVQKEKRTIPNSKFGSCGINSDANPCGDADEY
ncbi:MAG: hypothetical protein KC454_07835 [Flavobacteriales bacterium]|nr:hypothetical protein [Flavobacteriales bacterium]